MACKHPIWIRNRRYFDKSRPRRGFNVDDDHKSALSLRPWDVSRQWLMVPCGKCEDCLRRLRNDWFVRIERELARCKAESRQAIFITITINPLYYNRALQDPAWFIRKWNERVRHKIGHSFKHCFFQEFGTHPETGSEPRLHFHGFLFGTDVLYNTIRSAVSDLGFVWLAKATHKRARYCVKYVVKHIGFDAAEIRDKTVAIDGKSVLLSSLLQHRRYTRKFVSAGVGDYLGRRPAPSFSVTSWTYTDLGRGITYNYAIPRYYNRYLQPKDEQRRSIRSADAYARFSRSLLVRHVVGLCVKMALPSSALSSRETYSWELKKFREFTSAGDIPDIQAPVWLDRDIVRFWHDHYGLSLT
ncbi:replication initiator protein [Dipodfec virus UA23Rod_963]|uniref:Replication initiator protein n=1 Tax=Dipodfec virus UA23Rod_963 TaxID=2929335 RepID=A0A976N264_9VIRU|nr:replication initiator protein [Dipodfec virus UA23Rod_963]